MTFKIQGGYRQRKFIYKDITFVLQRDSEGAGWYCNNAYLTKDRTIVESEYWTGGDTHYYRLTDVMNGLKEEIDTGKFIIRTGHILRECSDKQ